MKSFATLVMLGAAAAAPHTGHAQFHKKDFTSMVDGVMADVSSLISEGMSTLAAMGAKAPINSFVPTDDSWIGNATTGNAVVNTIVNNSGKNATFVCWGAAGSWVNAIAPIIAILVPDGKNVTISHAIAQSGAGNTGACAPVFPDTRLVNGQVNQTWLEYTWGGSKYSIPTFDLSQEVNMQGHNMSVVSPKCTSDANRCSFKCIDDSVTSCMNPGTYELVNCDEGSQVGASRGFWEGTVSGGCQGISKIGITMITTILHLASN